MTSTDHKHPEPIRAMIIDDESSAIELIEGLIKELSLDIIVTDIAMNGLEAIKKIAADAPDLIFLDVEMPFVNGIEVLEKFPERTFETIFTTSSSEHALKALKLKALDYLLKPINPADFILAIESVKEKIRTRQARGGLTTDRIHISSLNETVILDANEIISIAGSGSYSHFNMKNKQSFILSKSLGQIEESLAYLGYFFRCHQSYIVNIDNIYKILSKDGLELEMKDGTKIPVSRRSRGKLMQLIRPI